MSSRRALRPYRQACQHPVGDSAPIVQYPKSIGQGGDALVSGADDGRVARAQPGGFLVAQHLAYMMLVQALRPHLAEGLGDGAGWLFALADKKMSVAINVMHDDPTHRWTLQELAKRAGMSRSTFALKFKQTAGESPMEYLTRWRMLLAADRLASSSDSISSSRRRLATNPKATSAQPSRGSWAVRHGNIAAARIAASPSHSEGGQPAAPIGSSPSQGEWLCSVPPS